MLVAGITLLIGLLFGGSNLSTFLVEDLPKEIKHNVEDKEKQKQILAVLKEYEKEFKKTQKEIGKITKELKKLNLDRSSSKDTIINEFMKSSDLWKKLQTDGVNSRLEVIDLLTEEEWEKVIANSVAAYDKKETKKSKKIYEQFDKDLNKIKEEIKKNILDVNRANKIEDAFYEFSTDIKTYMDANMERTLRDHEAFRNKHATKDELLTALSTVEEARNKVFEGIIDLHFQLVELTTEDEWKELAKATNELY